MGARDGGFAVRHVLVDRYSRVIRRAFHHFYHEFAWTYDTVAWLVSGGLWQRWVLVALPELRGRTLELGFGTGQLQLALADRPAVVGLDFSPQMSRLAARRLRRAGYCPRLVRSRSQTLPFPDASFDSLVATFPAEYLLDPQTHAEIRRVLAPGGQLVMVPFAELAPGPYARLVEFAYRLTLQAPPQRQTPVAPPQLLNLGGLVLKPRWVQVGPSRVLLLIGTEALRH